MKNPEFKIKKSKEQTVYTLESASVGGTSAGSVASVSSTLGGVRKRGDNLLAQESNKDKIAASKPRNYVAKNAKMGRAGAHKDKKKEQKQGATKHKTPYTEGDDLKSFKQSLGNAVQGQVSQTRANMAIQKAKDPGTWKWQPGTVVYSPHTGKTYEIVDHYLDSKGRAMYFYKTSDGEEKGTFIANKAHQSLKKISEDVSVKESLKQRLSELKSKVDEISMQKLQGYLPAAERSRNPAREVPRKFGASPEEKAKAAHIVKKREAGMNRYRARHMAANPELYKKPEPRPQPKPKDPYIDYSDDYATWAKGRRDTQDNKGTSEGYSIRPGFDKERYQERPGLEGPFHTKSGKVVYYDPKEGKYYDPDSDFYIDYDDWRAMNDEYMESLDQALQNMLNEKAPPGDKYERMVKHIKKGYAKDGKLSKKEKSIAYATAWKAKNKSKK